LNDINCVKLFFEPVAKSKPKKCYSTCHIKSYGICMEY
jgi:hypothetical protein